jgi:hypothetical protein
MTGADLLMEADVRGGFSFGGGYLRITAPVGADILH